MYRPAYASPINPLQWQDICARLLAPLILWICVSVSLRYGYYGDCHLVLGPNSSRLFKASSIFVEQIQVRDGAKKGVSLYGFSEKPELSLETKWNMSNYLIVGSYGRQGFSMWLNKGSRIQVRWEVPTKSFSDLQVVVLKGQKNLKRLLPYSSNSLTLSNTTIGNGQAKYIIEEDDSYYVGMVNMNTRSIVMALNISVSSMMYDTTKAESKCSTMNNGLCRLKLLFPNTKFVILNTPDNGNLEGWYFELTFVARIINYFAIIGIIAVIIFFILKYLGACGGETAVERMVEEVPETETNPLLSQKTIQFVYGTGEESPESRMSNSSEDLYDGKICVICYDEQRNCFFVPCGHCATCYACAQRIVEGESKVCPICRRFIHRVRRLFST